MDKKRYCAPYIIDRDKGTLRKRESYYSELNHSSVKMVGIQNFEGIYGAMQKLMKHKKNNAKKSRYDKKTIYKT